MPPTLFAEARITDCITPESSICSEIPICGADVAPSQSSFEDKTSIRRNGCEYITFFPEALKHVSKLMEEEKQKKYTQIGEQYNMVFKMSRSNTRLIKTFLHSYGFTQCSSKNPNFNVLWAGAHLKAYKMRNLKPWQRVNQFPRSSELTRKDKLYENIARSQILFGDAYDFIPEFYVTPRDMVRMTMAFENKALQTDRKEERFIVKPVSSSQGKGIFFVNSVEEVPLKDPLLVSKYVDNPLLVNEHKFDLRIYVAVTSFHPLVVYVYSEGLTRLASGKYSSDLDSVSDEFIHLTNYSINKNNSNFIRNESMTSEDFGHKWTLGALLRHLEDSKIDSRLLMMRIEDIIIKSLLSVQSTVLSVSKTTLQHVGTNFELFGFDILIDSDLKPWLLEVNLSPSLSCDAPLDSLVKSRLIADLLNLACVPLVHKNIIEVDPREEDSLQCKSADKKCQSPTRQTTGLSYKKKVQLRKIRSSAAPTSPLKTALMEMRFKSVMKKLRMEHERKGDFVRIFPRRNSYDLYQTVLDYSTLEKLDQRVYEEEFGTSSNPHEIEKVIELFHDVMIQSAKYPTFDHIPSVLQRLIRCWYETSSIYTEKITKEGEKYAAKLPVVRVTARLRTKSCSDWYDLRKVTLEETKARELAEKRRKEELEQNNQENAPP